jgi:transcriptional regulator with XRE-family HTH domain
LAKIEMTPLAVRLKQIREQRGFTQEQVSEKINVEIGTLSGYERAYRKPSPEMLSRLADLYVCSADYLLGRVDSPNDELVRETTEPLDPSIERIGFTDPSPAAMKIASALESDPELLSFWGELSKREDLQLLFRQTKSMTPETIRKVMRIIKAIEDDEVGED